MAKTDMTEALLLKTKQKRTKKYNYFIGIDISKNELDYAVLHNKQLLFHRESKNHPDDILTFIAELKTLSMFNMSKSIFCMEQTGIYCNHLLKCLKKHKANIVIENPLQIKNSTGLIRGKNDKIDSIRIAQYAQKNCDDLRLWLDKRPVMIDLAALYSLRNKMLSLQVALKTPLRDQAVFLSKRFQRMNLQLCQSSIDSIKNDLIKINNHIDQLIDSDLHLKRLLEIITSVPNIGKITAIAIINSTNEFRNIQCPRKFACYSGVAPFEKESGLSKGKASVSHIANKKMKSLLHICALGALRYDNEMRAYYLRKTTMEGKPPMVVINAIRSKLILRIFSCVNKDRLYVKNTKINDPP
jgi:transposase